MNKPDQWVIITLLLLIVLHLAIGITGRIYGRQLFFTTLLNLITGSSILIYWIQKQFRISQHIFEQREILALCLEGLLVMCAIYYFASGKTINYIRVIQYLFFGVHFLLLVAGLVFMLTFKMNRLV